MLEKTDRPRARWKIIPGDDKQYARVAVVEHVCHAIETKLAKRGYNLGDAGTTGLAAGTASPAAVSR
jgi:hypothetical protein